MRIQQMKSTVRAVFWAVFATSAIVYLLVGKIIETQDLVPAWMSFIQGVAQWTFAAMMAFVAFGAAFSLVAMTYLIGSQHAAYWLGSIMFIVVGVVGMALADLISPLTWIRSSAFLMAYGLTIVGACLFWSGVDKIGRRSAEDKV